MQNDNQELMVTVPLSEYSRLVQTVARLECEVEINKLNATIEMLKEQKSNMACRAYLAEEKLKRMEGEPDE